MIDWLKRLVFAAKVNRIIDGPSYRRRETIAGTILEFGETAGGFGFSVYRFKEHFGNYIEATSWDGTHEGTTRVKIAKPMELWRGLGGDTIDGVVFTYSGHDDAAQTRHASGDDGTEEDQVIVPRYTPDSLIWVAPALALIGADGNLQSSPPTQPDMGLIDLNRAGRVYAQI